jgi:hypothetical protein
MQTEDLPSAIIPASEQKAYLGIDQSRQWQIIKQVCKEFPDVGISIFPQTLVVETINLGNLSRLVIPT